MRSKQLADLVRDDLIAGFAATELTPAPSVTPVSEFAPFREDNQLSALTVICFPFQRDLEVESRGSDKMTTMVGIFVAMARGVNQSNDALAAYCGPLVEQIGLRMIRIILDGATCLKVQHEPLFDHERLRTNGIFESIITCEFHESATAA